MSEGSRFVASGHKMRRLRILVSFLCPVVPTWEAGRHPPPWGSSWSFNLLGAWSRSAPMHVQFPRESPFSDKPTGVSAPVAGAPWLQQPSFAVRKIRWPREGELQLETSMEIILGPAPRLALPWLGPALPCLALQCRRSFQRPDPEEARRRLSCTVNVCTSRYLGGLHELLPWASWSAVPRWDSYAGLGVLRRRLRWNAWWLQGKGRADTGQPAGVAFFLLSRLCRTATGEPKTVVTLVGARIMVQ